MTEEPRTNGAAAASHSGDTPKPYIFTDTGNTVERAAVTPEQAADSVAEPPSADVGAPVTAGHEDSAIVAAEPPAPIVGRLRKAPLRVPDECAGATGFTLFGRRIRSLLYSTDVAVIRNSNADAIFAVYPFTAQPAITQALLTVAEAPLFVGVGGGTTTGRRAAELAAVSEMQGAAGVVLNSPATPEMVSQIATTVDIPVVATITQFDNEAAEKVYAGARIINVAAGKNTAEVIRALRAAFPNLPIIATGGKDGASAQATVSAGANALIWAPPSVIQLQKDMMVRYRKASEAAAAAVVAEGAPEVPEVAVPANPDITDMPVATIVNGTVKVSPAVPPEEVAKPVANRGFVSPFHGRLPRLRLFRKAPAAGSPAPSDAGSAQTSSTQSSTSSENAPELDKPAE